MVKGRKDQVAPLDPWSGGSGDGGKEGGEMSKNLTNLKSKPGEGLCVFVLMEALMEPLKYFQDFFSIFGKEGKVRPLLSGKSAPIFPSFCNPAVCPCISGDGMLFLPWHSPHHSVRVCIFSL